MSVGLQLIQRNFLSRKSPYSGHSHIKCAADYSSSPCAHRLQQTMVFLYRELQLLDETVVLLDVTSISKKTQSNLLGIQGSFCDVFICDSFHNFENNWCQTYMSKIPRNFAKSARFRNKVNSGFFQTFGIYPNKYVWHQNGQSFFQEIRIYSIHST